MGGHSIRMARSKLFLGRVARVAGNVVGLRGRQGHIIRHKRCRTLNTVHGDAVFKRENAAAGVNTLKIMGWVGLITNFC